MDRFSKFYVFLIIYDNDYFHIVKNRVMFYDFFIILYHLKNLVVSINNWN